MRVPYVAVGRLGVLEDIFFRFLVQTGCNGPVNLGGNANYVPILLASHTYSSAFNHWFLIGAHYRIQTRATNPCLSNRMISEAWKFFKEVWAAYIRAPAVDRENHREGSRIAKADPCTLPRHFDSGSLVVL